MHVFRIWRRAIALLCAAALCAASAPARSADPMRISIIARPSGAWLMSYAAATATTRLDLGPTLEGFRARTWSIETAGLSLVSEDGRDFIISSKPFRRAAIAINAAPIAQKDWPVKDYRPIAAMGEAGVLLYTGHFSAYENGARLRALYDVKTPQGWSIYAFGRAHAALEGWSSPFAQPAFLYLGPDAPRVDGPSALIDARAPQWIKQETARLPARATSYFDRALGRSLAAAPDVFVTVGDLSIPGRLSLLGDALPGQFQATLDGDVWRMETPQAGAALRGSIVHEIAHLYQLLAESKPGTPVYIHEGGADALAGEALVAMNLSGPEDRRAGLEAALSECAALTQGVSLKSRMAAAQSPEDWRAAYACGHVLNVAAGGRAGPAAFWRAFIERAATDLYDEALFFALIEEREGDALAAAIKAFARTNHARPRAELERLLALSGALSALP